MTGYLAFADGVKEGFLEFGIGVSFVVNCVLLTAVYLAVVGPMSLLAKASGKRFLETGRKEGSYWTDIHLGYGGAGRFYKQF